MIVLQAMRLNAPANRFQYRIEASSGELYLLSDPVAAAAKLEELGVSSPGRLVAHVRTWGVVHIVPDRGL